MRKGLIMRTGIAALAVTACVAVVAGYAGVSYFGSSGTGDPRRVRVETAADTGDTNLAADSGDVRWYTDWNEGMAAAKAADKPVYVHFTADWCRWCKEMKKNTYSVPEVRQRFMDDWIVLKIDVEDRNATGTAFLNESDKQYRAGYDPDGGPALKAETLTNQELFQFFGGQGLPTLAFFDNDGQLIYPHPGYLPKDQFMHVLDYFRGELYEQNVKLDDYMKSKSRPGRR